MFSVLCKRILKKNAYLHVDFEVRRSKRVSDQMGKNDGPAGGTIDLTSDHEIDNVSGMNVLN
jgi:hypothetical protein